MMTHDEYQDALIRIDELMNTVTDKESYEGKLLTFLVDMVMEYENHHFADDFGPTEYEEWMDFDPDC